MSKMYKVIEIENTAEYQTLTSCLKHALERFTQAALFSDYVAIMDDGGEVIRYIGEKP